MVNMLKVLIAMFILVSIVAIAILGFRLTYVFSFNSAKKQPESLWLEVVSILLALTISIGGYIKNKPEPTWWMWTGCFVLLIGSIIHFIAKKQLGTRILEDKLTEDFKLAIVGVYRYIRHPSKTGLLLMLIGIATTLGSIWGIIIVIVFYLPSLLYGIAQEDRELEDQFGQRYITYKEETKKIIPFVL